MKQCQHSFFYDTMYLSEKQSLQAVSSMYLLAIVPRLWHFIANPLECNDYGIDGDPARECFASDKWKKDVPQKI